MGIEIEMKMPWVVLAVAASLFTSVAFAGGSATLRGLSDEYAVEFQDPLADPETVIGISEWVQDDLGYAKKLPPLPFKSECRATKNEIRCRKKGRSPLACAVYKRTLDGSPTCPGQAEYRFTCVAGCTPTVPRYISISPDEC